ncbi:hypothetical protein GRI58_03925 [Porphyrobacter algicida]|uniref:Right handed beta helix domain-containing protein n=1 Tax=Qipengyuania algicida TaxID=1836209 RepID=A0A845ACI8_9SPHN|nr:right-handed parallel beta-helix repeat-containing protein [Qipengyuania algicida]MXP27970.1 hypothetical protein [Qipengyuania algicida]
MIQIDRRKALAWTSSSIVCGAFITGQAACAGTELSVTDFGASVTADPVHNRSAFLAAIDKVPTGGALVVPASEGGVFAIDTSGGLTEALAIQRKMRIILNGGIRATHGEVRENPPYLFRVEGDDVAIVGNGFISGPGASDSRNLKADISHPGLIFVTGDRFCFSGPLVQNVPKIGIHLWNCRNAAISATWRGGIRDYIRGNTALFGIRATGGGGHHIVGNRFERDDLGRRLISGYFAGGLHGETTGDVIEKNIADVHEKLAYLYASDALITDNLVHDAVQTDIVRLVGSRNIVEKLSGNRIKGGVSIYNGKDNIVRNCKFSNVMQAGIYASFQGDYKDSISGTEFIDNEIIAASHSSELQDAICIYAQSGRASNIRIVGNTVSASGEASWRNCVRVVGVPPNYVSGAAIVRNDLGGGKNGLELRRLVGAQLEYNRITDLRGGNSLVEISR